MILRTFSSLTVPLILLICGLLLFSKKRDLFPSFIEGAKSGLSASVSILPTMVILLTSISMLRASGATEAVSSALAPILSAIGIPSEILPLLLIRPFSGSATSAAFVSLLKEVGADSYPALAASVIMGSSDTAVYIAGIYFSSAPSVKHTRYLFPVAFTVMLFGIFFSCFLARLFQ